MSLQVLMQTKAGRRFAGFLKTFNAGDLDSIESFVADYSTDEALEANSAAEWRTELNHILEVTGGLRVQQVLAADEYRVVILMEARTNGVLYLTEMAVSEDYPHKIAEFIQRPAG